MAWPGHVQPAPVSLSASERMVAKAQIGFLQKGNEAYSTDEGYYAWLCLL
jgi:hypothetical protein